MQRFRLRTSFAALLIVLAAAGRAQSQGAPAAPPNLPFKKEIDAYMAKDAVSPPPADGILFIGSSIFARWSALAEQMAPLPAYNRAFGGSRASHMLYYMDKLVVPYKPRFVVYYCGSNDINSGASAEEITARITTFRALLEQILPNTRFFFVSVIRAPQKRNRWAAVDSVNARMRAYAQSMKNTDFIDVNPVLLQADGTIKPGMYLPDSLHYEAATYPLFTSVIKPVLQKAWEER